MECTLSRVELGLYWTEVENASRRNPLNKPEMCAICDSKSARWYILVRLKVTGQ